jgi:hypothetical protein
MKTQSLIHFIKTIFVELGVSSYFYYSKDNNTTYHFLALEGVPHPSYHFMCGQSANAVAVFRFIQFTLQAMMAVAKDEDVDEILLKELLDDEAKEYFENMAKRRKFMCELLYPNQNKVWLDDKDRRLKLYDSLVHTCRRCKPF